MRAPGGGEPDVLSRARARFGLIPALAVAVVVVGVVVRLALLGRQSYWTDEMFSVDQSAGGFARMLHLGRTEVHTPLYATLLWVWVHLGGTRSVWTRLLSGMFGLATIAAAWWCLRGLVSERARLIAVALTAATGFGIVYAQESRPYALALLGATGLTAVTLRRWVELRAGVVAARGELVWGAWALLTATAHLLGAVLVGVLAVVLAGVAWRAGARRGAARQLAVAAVALVPQLVWIAIGALRPGFAAGTSWIRPAGIRDVGVLATTIFSSGGMSPRADGFAWTSWVGVLVVALLLAVAAGTAVVRRRARPSADPTPADGQARSDLRLGLVLVGLAATMIVVTFAVSQVVHIWTLRNMIVVLPAALWGVAWVVASLPGTERGRRGMAVALLVGALVSLGPVVAGLRTPYKTDWRSLVLDLAQVRADQPKARFTVFGGIPRQMLIASDRNPNDPALRRIATGMDLRPRTTAELRRLQRVGGPQVVVYYPGVGHAGDMAVRLRILRRLGDPRCTTVPVYGLAVVSCP